MTENEKKILTILSQMHYYGLKDEVMIKENGINKLSFTIPSINEIYPENGSIAEGFDISDEEDFMNMIKKCINDIMKYQVNEMLIDKANDEKDLINILNNIKEFYNDKFEIYCNKRNETWTKKDGIDAIDNFLYSVIRLY